MPVILNYRYRQRKQADNRPKMLRFLSILIAIIAILIGISTHQFLPIIIDKLISLENNNNNPNLERLRIGHAMAGGGQAGTMAITDAIKTTVYSKIFGVKSTSSRVAWREFTTVLRDAERRYLSPSWGFGLGPDDDDDDDFAADEIAEGLRYVSHVSKLALDVYLEDAPRFVRFVSPTLKLLGDNPDAIYYLASLRSHHHQEETSSASSEFIVEGCKGKNEVYFSLSVHAPSLSNTKGGFERVISDVNDEKITFDSNGCYKIYLSPTNPGEEALKITKEEEQEEGHVMMMTWLETPKEATSLVTRHYFRSPSSSSTCSLSTLPPAMHEQVNLSIRLLKKKQQQQQAEKYNPPTPVTDATIAHRINLATDFIKRHTILMPQPDPTTAPPFFSLLPNTIGIPQKWQHGAEGMGAVDIAYAAGRYRLEENQALVLEGVVPPCRFGNVVLWNRYLQTFDYTRNDDYPVFHTLNVPTAATADDDGGEEQESAPFTIVLSGKKPSSNTNNSSKKYKWLYTEGRQMGTIFFRFLLPKGDGYVYERINTTVVSVDEISEYLKKKRQKDGD